MWRVKPFCMVLLLSGTFCFSWHFQNDIDDFCRWQQQLFSLKVGASGALFGLIGLLIVKLLQLRHDVRRPCCEVLCLLSVALISFGKYNNNLQNKNTESLNNTIIWKVSLKVNTVVLRFSCIEHRPQFLISLDTVYSLGHRNDHRVFKKTQISLQSFDHYCWKYLYVVTVHQ